MEKEPHEGASILIIDDDVRLCRLIVESFADSGYTIHAVHNGSTGLSRALEEHFDIILLDLSLPDSMGLANFKYILKYYNVPIIIYTGLTDESVKNEALKYGAMDYLIKGKTTNEALKESILNSIKHYIPGSKTNL